MNDKKYELLPAEASGPYAGLHRIRALRDIPRHCVLKGDLGGYVSSEANLSQLGSAWVADLAWVTDSARVADSALVTGSAWVTGSARVSKPVHTFAITGPTPECDSASICRLGDGTEWVHCGCWEGTIEQLRELAHSDEWPSGRDAEYRETYRPSLLAVADLFEARKALW